MDIGLRVQDKQALRNLLREQFHEGVSPEVLRELSHGGSRGDPKPHQVTPAALQKGPCESIFQMAPVVVNEMEF